ncbi:MAG: hypothetical protein IE885_03550 [Campylobacterales bacterium]|nr:hypothetical protein [Campylobacterales bacterium]
MFKKFTPLIILGLFALGTYFMIQGMHKAVEMTDHQKVKEKKAATNGSN